MVKTAAEYLALMEDHDFSSVIYKYSVENKFDEETSRETLEEMKKWLAMCASNPNNDYVLFGEVDVMWHQFILFTKKYREFCDQVFGYFLDHVPGQDERIKKIIASEESDVLKAKLINLKKDGYKSFMDDYKSTFNVDTLPYPWESIDDLKDRPSCGCGCKGSCLCTGPGGGGHP
ncbi:glycine-rich domain-containing protein [Pseudomonadota bacterium]